jgi:hypothetical protein
MGVTNRNEVNDEIKIIINFENACYYSVQKLISPQSTSQTAVDKDIQKNNFAMFCMGVKCWSLTLGEKHKLQGSENNVIIKNTWI